MNSTEIRQNAEQFTRERGLSEWTDDDLREFRSRHSLTETDAELWLLVRMTGPRIPREALFLTLPDGDQVREVLRRSGAFGRDPRPRPVVRRGSDSKTRLSGYETPDGVIPYD